MAATVHDPDLSCSSPLSSPAPSPSMSSSRSSSPLSCLTRSPTPPEELMRLASTSSHNNHSGCPYPSPPASQQTSQSGSPAPDGMESRASSDKEGPPPAKRRRISEKTERTTEYLDLRESGVSPGQQRQLDRVVNVLHKRQKIVVIAGAGISVSAGIPDFRSSQGLFRSLKEEYNLKGSGKDLFDASVYKDDASTSSFHDLVSSMSRLTKDAKPTAFHHMLATIAQEDRLLRLYSQNVDGIDTSLEPLRTSVPLKKEPDGKWPRTVQLHGGLDKMVCSKCHELSDLDPSLFDGPVPPLCPRCEEINDIRTNHEGKRSHGIGRLRPRMVLYNEHNPDDEAIGTVTKDDLRKRPDAVIVVGTTLKVPGVRRIVREMCATVRDRRGGVAIWINGDPPPVGKDLEDCWDIIVRGPCDEVAKHAAMRKWDAPAVSKEFAELSDEAARKAAAKSLKVQLPAKCQPKHLPKEPLPSSLHKNNSFKPPSPDDTPTKVLDHGPVDWSPISAPPASVVQSIEATLEGDNVTLPCQDQDLSTEEAQLLQTPSKSRRNSPAKKNIPKFPNLTDTKKGAAKQQPANKSEKTEAPAKKRNVKQVRPPLSKQNQGGKKAATAKPKKQTLPKITLKFSSSKSSSLAVRTGKADPDSPTKSPSKLRQVTNASPTSEPMHPLLPQDPRMNSSPVHDVGETPQIPEKEVGGNPMSITSLTN